MRNDGPRKVWRPWAPWLLAVAGLCCCSVPEPAVPSGTPASEEHLGAPSPLARDDEDMRWHCFENRSMEDTSGCGRTRAECAKMVSIRREAFARFGVPFDASSCEPFEAPYCYYYRDADMAYTRWDCAKTATACERSFVNNEFEVLSECTQVGADAAAGQRAAPARR